VNYANAYIARKQTIFGEYVTDEIDLGSGFKFRTMRQEPARNIGSAVTNAALFGANTNEVLMKFGALKFPGWNNPYISHGCPLMVLTLNLSEIRETVSWKERKSEVRFGNREENGITVKKIGEINTRLCLKGCPVDSFQILNDSKETLLKGISATFNSLRRDRRTAAFIHLEKSDKLELLAR